MQRISVKAVRFFGRRTAEADGGSSRESPRRLPNGQLRRVELHWYEAHGIGKRDKFIHLATGMPLDVVLAGSGLEDEFLDRAVPTDVGGTRIPLIEAGDLIIAKVLAGRPKDLDDGRSAISPVVPRSPRTLSASRFAM